MPSLMTFVPSAPRIMPGTQWTLNISSKNKQRRVLKIISVENFLYVRH